MTIGHVTTTTSAAKERTTAKADPAGRTAVNVDPALLSIIRSAGVPAGMPKFVQPPAAVPGPVSRFAGPFILIQLLRHGIAYSSSLRNTYGDVHRVSVAGVPMVMVWDADEIHRIVKNEEQVWSAAIGWNAAMFDGFARRGGNTGTLLTLDFDDHRIARKLVQPAFTPSAIEGYLAIAHRSVAPAVSAWIERRQVDFKREIHTLLGRVAAEIFTGIREPEKARVVDRAVADFWHGILAMARNPWLSPTFRRARKGFETLIQTFLALVPERRRSGGDDLFSRMCATEGADGLSDEAMVRVFVTILFGAFDTTSAGLTSMAYLLAKHPKWQDRLREEARAVRGEHLDMAAVKSLKQHEWVWKETLRFMPVTSYVPRCALRDVVVGGYELPAGTLVMPMSGAMGHHPKWWTAPNTFDPERFSVERAEDRRHPAIFNPFGAGAHACLGMQLADMEMKVLWHRVLTSYRFRLAPDYEARHTFAPLGIVSGKVRLALEPIRG